MTVTLPTVVPPIAGREKPRLLGVCMYPAFPPYNGGSTRVYNLALACSDAFDITYYAQSLRLNGLVHARWNAISTSYRECRSIDPLSFAAEVAGRVLGIPQLAQSNILSLAAPAWLRAAARGASIISVEQPWQYQWARQMCGPRTKVVYHAHNVEADMFDVARMRLPRAPANLLMASIRRQERAAVRGADCVFATSPDDARTLAERYGRDPEKVRVIPNGVDCTYIRPCSPDERNRSKADLGLAARDVILFCGAKHPPNRQAVEAILRWAASWSNRPVQFVIVGSVSTWFSHVRMPNVTFTGFVSDLRPYFNAADVTINPMMTGGGTNLKQLEYLASGAPSVATAFGARGIPIVDGRDGFIRDIDAMPATVEHLLNDPNTRAAIGANGRALAVRDFDWTSIGNRLIGIYCDLIASGSRKDFL